MDSFIKVIQAMVLGIVEGLTEFIPVSSTGHLVIVSKLIGFERSYANSPGFVTAYNYIIQLGAILAIVVFQRKQIIGTIRNFMPSKLGFHRSGLRFWATIAVACVPGAILEFTLGDYIEERFFGYVSIAVALTVGAVVMAVVERFLSTDYMSKNVIDISFPMAVIIGLFQCLAIFPGVSRSAATIIGGMACGLSMVASAQFSFFLAIPVMLGMSALKLIKLGFIEGLTAIDYISLLVGFAVSFVIALFVVNAFLNILRKNTLVPFAIYRIGLAFAVLITGIFGII